MSLASCLFDSRSRMMGNIGFVQGQVYLARAQLMHPQPVTQSYPLYVDDTLESQSQSGVQILVNRTTRLVLGPDSRLIIQEPPDSAHAVVALERGTVRIAMTPDTEEVFVVVVLAAGTETTVREGEATVWALEDMQELSTPGPHFRSIDTVGVINHGTRGEVAFGGREQTVTIRPGFLSVTTPNSSPVQAVAIEAAKPFATHMIRMTDLERRPNETAAVVSPMNPLVKRTLEPAEQRDCKKKSKVRGIQPNSEKTGPSTDCR